MNISYNWLKEYISFDLSPEQLVDILTSIGLETRIVRKIESVKSNLNGLVIGKVLFCEKHPNSDLLYVTTIDIGTDKTLQIVCGASNIEKNQKVIIATVGTALHSTDKPFCVKKLQIKGIESQGMICSEYEIGIGTNQAEIITLPEKVMVGTFAKDYYQKESDYTLEVDITPNRIDAASHYGIARDLAAYLSFHNFPVTVSPIKVSNYKIDNPTPIITVEVKDHFACPRYTGVTIKNVEVKESPLWLKKRLETIGVHSVNNIVDVTNYVLHESGQPLHAFDLKAISGNKIIVQILTERTSFVTLDRKEKKLSGQDLMICDKEKSLCIGGICGGLNSMITTSTKDLFLESAYFNPIYIRRTARFHGLNTDASFHFERGTDPNQTLQALKRAALLIREVAGGIICGKTQDVFPIKIPNPIITLNIQKIKILIGKTIPEKDIETIFKGLGILILEKKNSKWTLSIPTYRVDITREVDIIGEILRIYGYDKVETNQENYPTFSPYTFTDKSYELQNILSEQLTGVGFHEIVNNSLTSSSYYEDSSSFQKTAVFLKNPLSSDLNCMRQTLLIGGLKTIAYNSNRKQTDLKLYEFGNTYLYVPKNKKNNKDLSSIKEELHLALWITGYSIVGNWAHKTEKTSFFELKSYVENILARLKIINQKIIYHSLNEDFFSIGLSIKTTSGQHLGRLGILRKNFREKFEIQNEVYFAELNWFALMKENSQLPINQITISKFPSVKRDFSLLVDEAVRFSDIEKIAYQTNKKNLKEVILFDVYEGENIPKGKKSYAVTFVIEDIEKPLQRGKIEYIMGIIKSKLEKELNAKLR